MIRDSFMLQMLKGSDTMSFLLNNTILPPLYALLIFLILKLGFKFYNHDFVCSIKHLPYEAFRRRFLNFEHHNEPYQEHFFNDFHRWAHCTTSCDICIKHNSIHFSRINLELSLIKASYFDQEANNSKFRTFTSKPSHQQFFIINVPLLYSFFIWIHANIPLL